MPVTNTTHIRVGALVKFSEEDWPDGVCAGGTEAPAYMDKLLPEELDHLKMQITIVCSPVIHLVGISPDKFKGKMFMSDACWLYPALAPVVCEND